jgi:hypothetical protein
MVSDCQRGQRRQAGDKGRMMLRLEGIEGIEGMEIGGLRALLAATRGMGRA